LLASTRIENLYDKPLSPTLSYDVDEKFDMTPQRDRVYKLSVNLYSEITFPTVGPIESNEIEARKRVINSIKRHMYGPFVGDLHEVGSLLENSKPDDAMALLVDLIGEIHG